MKFTTVKNNPLTSIIFVKVIGNSILSFKMPAQYPKVLEQMKRNGQHCRIFLKRRISPSDVLSNMSFQFHYVEHVQDHCQFCQITEHVTYLNMAAALMSDPNIAASAMSDPNVGAASMIHESNSSTDVTNSLPTKLAALRSDLNGESTSRSEVSTM